MTRLLTCCAAGALCLAAAACSGSGPRDATDVAQVVILPNDTLLRVTGDEFTTVVDLEVAPDGTLLVRRSSGRSLTIEPNATTLRLTEDGAEGAGDTHEGAESRTNWTAPPRAELDDGGFWTVTDSVPRLRRISSAGVIEVDVPIVDVQLTPIRVRAAHRESAGAPSAPVRYATDVEVVGSSVWVLLNVSIGEGAVLLGFDPQGQQRTRMELPATEGGRQFAFDTIRSRLYAVGPEIPLVLAVNLEGHEDLWRGSP